MPNDNPKYDGVVIDVEDTCLCAQLGDSVLKNMTWGRSAARNPDELTEYVLKTVTEIRNAVPLLLDRMLRWKYDGPGLDEAKQVARAVSKQEDWNLSLLVTAITTLEQACTPPCLRHIINCLRYDCGYLLQLVQLRRYMNEHPESAARAPGHP